MTRLQKILHKFYVYPEGLRYSDIEKILVAFGCIKIPAKGSHIKFKHHLAKSDLVIPIHHNECKEFYKKSALKFVQDYYLDINHETIN